VQERRTAKRITRRLVALAPPPILDSLATPVGWKHAAPPGNAGSGTALVPARRILLSELPAKRLPLEQVRELGLAACRNVEAYWRDIEALQKAGRDVRAFALTVTAMEEFAKAFWASEIMRSDREEDWEHFWQSLPGSGRGLHERRIAVLLALEELKIGMGEGKVSSPITELVRSLRIAGGDLLRLRNSALYVEHLEGEVWSPGNLKDSETLRALTWALREAVAPWVVVASVFLDPGEEEEI
jgi:AbiV family abortive infection protein